MAQIFDSHAHIYPHKIAQKAAQSIGEFYQISIERDGSVETLLQNGTAAGISHFLVHSVATFPRQVISINDFISEQCKLHPDCFVGFGTIHPGFDQPCEEIERCISLGLHGIKIHPDTQMFNMDDERMFPIYQMLSDKHMPILIHCGDYRYTYSHPARLAHVLDLYPKLKVIAAHFGGWSLWDLAKEYILDKKCYMDTSSSLPFLGRVRGRELIEAYGVDRMLFGVDFPMWDHKEELKRFLDLGFSDTENEIMMWKNAWRVLED